MKCGKTVSCDQLEDPPPPKKKVPNELVQLSDFEAKGENMGWLLLTVFHKIPQERYEFR